MGFLRTIVILIFIWYVFSLLARFVFPLLLRLLFKKAAEKANQSYQNIPKQKEGEVTISHNPNNNYNANTDGEYVDYEEVK